MTACRELAEKYFSKPLIIFQGDGIIAGEPHGAIAMIVDISNDGKLRLVCDDHMKGARYEAHDGTGEPDHNILDCYVTQHHFVACARRDGADRNGLLMGTVRKANPQEWRILKES